MDTLLDECKTPLKTRYAFHRQYTHPERRYLADWLVVGPFPNADDRGLEFAFGPEFDKPRLDSTYQGISDLLRWKPLKAKADFVDLASTFSPNDHAVAYAVCWVYSEKARPASLEIGSDDGAKVWVNRRLVHSHHTHDYALRGEYRAGIFLPAGWSEILVKVEQITDQWGFFVEIVDNEGRGPLKDLKPTSAPQ